jgi:SIR2-like domain
LLDAICRKKEDLEFLMEELEILTSRDYLGSETLNSSPLGMGKREEERWPGLQQLANEATGLLSNLRKEVYLHYRTIPEPVRTKILKKPLDLIRDVRYPAVVFTTNYDPAVEKYCVNNQLRLVDGFVHDEQTQEYVWSRNAFDNFGGTSPENSLVLFKLHGSTNWVQDQAGS